MIQEMKMKFGEDDINMIRTANNGIGTLYCIKQEPYEPCEEVTAKGCRDAGIKEVILMFANTESVDKLIEELQNVKMMMDESCTSEKGHRRMIQTDLVKRLKHWVTKSRKKNCRSCCIFCECWNMCKWETEERRKKK